MSKPDKTTTTASEPEPQPSHAPLPPHEIRCEHIRTVTKALPIGGPNNVADYVRRRPSDAHPGNEIYWIPSERRFRITTYPAGGFEGGTSIYLHESRIELYAELAPSLQ